MSRASSLVVLVIYIVYFAYEMRPKNVEVPSIPLQTIHTDHHQHRRNQHSNSRLIRFSDRDVPTRARSTTLDSRGAAEEDLVKREAAPRSPPAGKRQAVGAIAAASPTKRIRSTEAHSPSSRFKENMAPCFQSMSPSKRTQMLSPSYRNSPTALPLSTVR